MAHGLVHLAAVAEADLDLGRVHVHIDAQRVDLDIERIHRLLLAVQHVFVGAAGRVREHLVTHEAAVDVAELLVGPRARRIRQARTAGDGDRAHAVAHRHRFGEELFAQHVGQAAGQGLLQRVGVIRIGRGGQRGAPLLHQLAFVPDGEAHVGPGQRVAAHGFDAVGQFGGVGLEELAPRGRGEEEFLDLDRGAHAAGGRAQLAAARIEQEGAGLLRRAREQGHFRHRGDGGQRLAAEAHGGDRFQVVQVGDLAGGVAAQGDGQFFLRNAAAVVLHRDQAHAAGQQAHGDLAGAGIERVVHQLAHG